MTKRAIPHVPKKDAPRSGFDEAVKENIETITGRRGNAIELLSDASTTADIIAKLNEIITRLQD